jgi:hypothetical protein
MRRWSAAARRREECDGGFTPPLSFYVLGQQTKAARRGIPPGRIRELRAAPTEAEKAAWKLLRDRRLGAKFRRQFQEVGTGTRPLTRRRMAEGRGRVRGLF